MNDFSYIDAHVHTNYSQNDCKQPMDGYLALLRGGTARGFGFADHLHPPSEEMSRHYANMNAYRFRGDEYIGDIRAARAEGLNAYAGIEVTYDAEYDDVCRRRALENEYDYRIASVHSFGGLWVTRNYWQSVHPGPLFLDMVNRYYDAALGALNLDWADVIAHIGVYRRFLPDGHQLIECARDLIQQREQELAKACACSDKIIEVNTSSLFKPSEDTMPGQWFLAQYRGFGGERICLSSDAHDVANANQGFAKTAQTLKEMGFDKLYYPFEEGPTPL